jgi:hypothetical protein
MSQLQIVEKTENRFKINITLPDKIMSVLVLRLETRCAIAFSSSASQFSFTYTSSLIFNDISVLDVQNVYQEIYNNFMSLTNEYCDCYSDGTQVPYDISQKCKAYRRNLPQLELVASNL